MTLEELKLMWRELEKFNDKVHKDEQILDKQYRQIIRSPFSRLLYSMSKGNQTIDVDKVDLYYALRNHTFFDTDPKDLRRCLRRLSAKGIIKKLKYTDVGVNFEFADGTPFEFMILNKVYPHLLDRYDVDTNCEERLGLCHGGSLGISRSLEEPNELVSGFCSLFNESLNIPHSWVEFKVNGVPYVIDIVLFAVISKEGYYKLRSPKDTIRIGCEEIKENYRAIKRTVDKYNCRMYLFFPDEFREVFSDIFVKGKQKEES